jgi:hypothetical protein
MDSIPPPVSYSTLRAAARGRVLQYNMNNFGIFSYDFLLKQTNEEQYTGTADTTQGYIFMRFPAAAIPLYNQDYDDEGNPPREWFIHRWVFRRPKKPYQK